MRKINVSIVGTVGIPANYGGFETLVENLVINQPDFINYTVFASSRNYKIKPKKYLKAKLKYLPFNANGIQSIIYDIVSLVVASKNSDIILLLGVSVIAEILFGPNVAFFGSQVTKNLINLLNSLGEQGIAALIIVFAVIFVYRKYLK